jgi:hypothetical protein
VVGDGGVPRQDLGARQLSLGKGKDSFSVAVVLCGSGMDQNHEITASLGSTLGQLRTG